MVNPARSESESSLLVPSSSSQQRLQHSPIWQSSFLAARIFSHQCERHHDHSDVVVYLQLRAGYQTIAVSRSHKQRQPLYATQGNAIVSRDARQTGINTWVFMSVITSPSSLPHGIDKSVHSFQDRMSYHPYAAACDQRASARSSAPCTSTPTTAYANVSSLPGSSAAEPAGYELWDAFDLESQAFPKLAQVERERKNALLARSQGRISVQEHNAILRDCLTKAIAIANIQRLGARRAARGEDSRELIQRDSGRTDAEMDKLYDQIERRNRIQMETGRRSEAQKFPRTVTRGL
ncbi:hypothetical protein EVG20_g647 [Dentipellis fragilis]|uniref:Uncharacterized protein n=1 Tax=Dentipellis fragilis TaxID=205917 RepID=A0A4Y9ZEV2_9AGAM|nr:hypothetical protein EVG20_g647 [Dentipellis fragilis]